MPRINYILVHKEEEPVLVYKVIRPDPTEKGFYTQSLSMDSFKNDYRIDELNELEYFVLTQKEFECHEEKRYKNIVVKEHNSVWNFYNTVGWDYKKKKFNNFKE